MLKILQQQYFSARECPRCPSGCTPLKKIFFLISCFRFYFSELEIRMLELIIPACESRSICSPLEWACMVVNEMGRRKTLLKQLLSWVIRGPLISTVGFQLGHYFKLFAFLVMYFKIYTHKELMAKDGTHLGTHIKMQQKNEKA